MNERTDGWVDGWWMDGGKEEKRLDCKNGLMLLADRGTRAYGRAYVNVSIVNDHDRTNGWTSKDAAEGAGEKNG